MTKKPATTAKKSPTKSTTAKKAPTKSTKTSSPLAPPVETAASKPAQKTEVPSAPTAKTVEPTVVERPQPVVVGPVMRKKELVDTVVQRSGIKKKDAKPVVESMLEVLGEALADGRELKLSPFGKLVVRKEKILPNGKVMVVKVRQSTGPIQSEAVPYSDAAE